MAISSALSSVQSLDRLGLRGDMRDDSAEILFWSFPQEALMSSSGMGKEVHFLMLSIQHFLFRPRSRPPSKVPSRMVLERLSWRDTCPNHASFCLVHKEVNFAPHLVGSLVLQVAVAEKFPHALGFESLDPFFQSQQAGYVCHNHGGRWRWQETSTD